MGHKAVCQRAKHASLGKGEGGGRAGLLGSHAICHHNTGCTSRLLCMLCLQKPLSSAPVSATKFNLLYMYGILGVNSTVTYRPPPGVAMQYVNVFGPPSAPVGGESGKQWVT